MTKEEKNQMIEELSELLKVSTTVYVADISGLNAETTHALRKLCSNRKVQLSVVKNTLLRKAMERSERNFDELFPVLKGNTSILISDTGNVPAKLIKEFRKRSDKPVLKGAWIEEAVFLGDNQLESLSNLKSKNELVGEIIALLQSPAKNVVSALKSSGGTLAGLLKTLEERAA
ncbi:50S ribosomal protein L10 [bacterium]|nr:50S ribosomal protein L10 [bacterium]